MTAIPRPLHGMLPPERLHLIRQFVRFGTVGLAGFGVDVACVYLLRDWVGLAGAGLVAWFAAASTTWALNRAWTFAGTGRGSRVRQWLTFLAANALGGVLNRGVFFLLVGFVPFCAEHPVFAVLAGVAAGVVVNFTLSRRVVFR